MPLRTPIPKKAPTPAPEATVEVPTEEPESPIGEAVEKFREAVLDAVQAAMTNTETETENSISSVKEPDLTEDERTLLDRYRMEKTERAARAAADAEEAAKRKPVDIDSIKPGMKPEESANAWAEIRRLLGKSE